MMVGPPPPTPDMPSALSKPLSPAMSPHTPLERDMETKPELPVTSDQQ